MKNIVIIILFILLLFSWFQERQTNQMLLDCLNGSLFLKGEDGVKVGCMPAETNVPFPERK